nr:MAG TPA: hypothetical protein [Caudoviricetes sp.]
MPVVVISSVISVVPFSFKFWIKLFTLPVLFSYQAGILSKFQFTTLNTFLL